MVHLLSIVVNSSVFKLWCVCMSVYNSVSLSEWVYRTTWCQTGLHDRLYRICRYNPFLPPPCLRPPPPPHDSTPHVWVLWSSSSSTFIPHPHNTACFSFIWFHRFHSLHHFIFSFIRALVHRVTWPLNYEICFHAVMVSRINDHAYLCTQLLHKWEIKKTDDNSVMCCLHPGQTNTRLYEEKPHFLGLY